MGGSPSKVPPGKEVSDEDDDSEITVGSQTFTTRSVVKGNKLWLEGRNIKHLPNLNEYKSVKLDCVTEVNLNRNEMERFDANSMRANVKQLSLGYNNIAIMIDVWKLKSLTVFDARENKLKGIPNLTGCSELRELFLGSNLIHDINGKNLPHKLELLSLPNNKMEELSDVADIPKSLVHLDLSGNEFKDIPDLQAFQKMKILNLGCNEIVEITTKTKLPMNLEQLDLSENAIESVGSLSDLHKLIYLYLRGNMIENIFNNEIPSTLEKIDLSNNQLESIPPIGQCKKMREIYLQGNQIIQQKKSDEVYIHEPNVASTVEIIDLSRNKMLVIPDLDNVKSLKDINLSFNDISVHMLQFNALHATSVNLSNNKLGSVPKLTSPHIVNIDFSRNKISRCNDLNGIQAKKVDLSYNQLCKVPDAKEADNLETLIMCHNEITSAVAEAQSKSVTVIDLTHNQLEVVPDLSRFTNLQNLTLSHNKLKNVDAGNISLSIESLDLTFNKIEEIDSFDDFQKMKKLDMSENPVTVIGTFPKSVREIYLTAPKKDTNATTASNDLENIDEEAENGLILKRWCFPNENVYSTLRNTLSNQTDSLYMPPKEVFETSYAAVLKYFENIIDQAGKEKQPVKVEYGKQGGKIDQEGGGIFSVEEKWITVSVPDESEKHDNTQIDETKDEDDELADKIAREAEKRQKENEAIFIKTTDTSNVDKALAKLITSDILTMQPHGREFEEHLLVKFPLVDYKSNMRIIYNSTGDTKNPNWILLPVTVSPLESNKNLHAGPFFWVVHDGYCYLFMTHFCDFAMVQNPEDFTEENPLWIRMALYARYYKEENQLEITLALGCRDCKGKQLVSAQKEYGEFFKKENFLVFGKVEPLKFKLSYDDGCSEDLQVCDTDEQQIKKYCDNLKQEMNPTLLQMDCKLEDELQTQTFLLRATKPKLNIEQEFNFKIAVSQSKYERKEISGYPVKIIKMAVVSRNNLTPVTPIEKKKTTFKSMASEVGSIMSNITGTMSAMSIMSSQIIEKSCNCYDCKKKEKEKEKRKFYGRRKSKLQSQTRSVLFHTWLKVEQNDLCVTIESDTEKYKELIKRLGYQFNNKLKAVFFLRIFQTMVKNHAKTAYVWKTLWLELKAMEWDGPRVRLENLYQKDQILKKASLLKDNMRFSQLKEGLLHENVLDEDEKRYIKQPFASNAQKLDFLFFHVLLPEDWTEGSKIFAFNKVARKSNYGPLIDMLTLH